VIWLESCPEIGKWNWLYVVSLLAVDVRARVNGGLGMRLIGHFVDCMAPLMQGICGRIVPREHKVAFRK
jgi:hypothetical protein